MSLGIQPWRYWTDDAGVRRMGGHIVAWSAVRTMLLTMVRAAPEKQGDSYIAVRDQAGRVVGTVTYWRDDLGLRADGVVHDGAGPLDGMVPSGSWSLTGELLRIMLVHSPAWGGGVEMPQRSEERAADTSRRYDPYAGCLPSCAETVPCPVCGNRAGRWRGVL